MADGILDLLGLAATAVFAAPIAMFGVWLLTDGRALMGVALVAVAVGMLAFEEYVATPSDLLSGGLSGLVGLVAKDPEEEDRE
jgi:hypothetical protein